jgi:gamma-glutamyltranspeptidase / glutathione hydrolase
MSRIVALAGRPGAPKGISKNFRNLRAVLLPAALLAGPAWLPAAPPAAAIASAQPLATEAGFEVLAAGGNAFDAAIAVTAALAVVEPYSTGLGGGGFWLLHRARDGRDVMVDGRERAPLAARKTMYLDAGGAVVPQASIDGALAAAIPGTPAALAHLAEHYGRLPLEASVGPAIRLARRGFPVTPRYQRLAAARLRALQHSRSAARVFLRADRVPSAGTTIAQDELAGTLETVAREGAAGFYRGPIARALVSGVRQAGGIWTLEDLAQYRLVERAPIQGEYRGIRITSAAPPSSGGIALLTALNILSGYPLGRLDALTEKHLIVEALRRAYRDRAEYLGDPDRVEIPVQRLIHPYYASGLRASIRLDRATPRAELAPAAEEGQDTTHFSVLDGEGNRVAATVTINYPFGSAFMPPGTGVLLNDEMDDFSAKPGVPNVYGLVGAEANAIAPGKRPLSSMSPTFLEGTRGVAVLGTPGGGRIISMVLLATLDFTAGKDPDFWVSRPRFHHQYLPDEIEYEPGALSVEEVAGLQRLGHRLRALDERYGNMQALLWDRARNQVLAASDPRGEGSARVGAAEEPARRLAH